MTGDELTFGTNWIRGRVGFGIAYERHNWRLSIDLAAPWHRLEVGFGIGPLQTWVWMYTRAELNEIRAIEERA